MSKTEQSTCNVSVLCKRTCAPPALTTVQLQSIKPLLALLDAAPHLNIVTQLTTPGGRRVTLDVSAAGLALKAEYADSPPALELYRTAMGLAQAYRVPLTYVQHTEEN